MSSTNRGNKRIAHDSYQTPIWCVDLLMNELNLSNVDSFLEPCAGDGNIYNLFCHFARYADSCEIKKGTDYLLMDVNSIAPDYKFDLIVTNPPFSLALEFLEKSLNEALTVIYLLRLNFLGSQKRKEFWQKNRPSHVFVLSKRPSFTENGKTDSIEYAWFVWRGKNVVKKEPGIYVL